MGDNTVQQNKQKKKPLFSFVVAVHNTGKYLDDMFESLIDQTLNFEENCEVILVDDGSTDNSIEQCQEYVSQYPDNIQLLTKKHLGVSTARNAGLQVSRGQYLSFLDSDDMLSSDTLESVDAFFTTHDSEIDIVAIKLEFFESKSGDHFLNYKFDDDRIVDINKDYEDILLSSSSAFIRKDAIDTYKASFDEKLIAGEDAKFISSILLHKKKYGVLKDPVYHYRKRETDDSAINTVHEQRGWYFESLTNGWLEVAKMFEDEYGYLPKYAQFMIMYDIQWRLKKAKKTELSDKDLSVYKKLLFQLIDRIDPDIINAQKHLSRKLKLYLTSRLYSKRPTKPLISKEFELVSADQVIRDYKKGESRVTVLGVQEIDASLHLNLQVTELLIDNIYVRTKLNNEETTLERVQNNDVKTELFGETVYSNGGYTVVIPRQKIPSTITLYLQSGKQSKQLTLKAIKKVLTTDSFVVKITKQELIVEPKKSISRKLLFWTR